MKRIWKSLKTILAFVRWRRIALLAAVLWLYAVVLLLVVIDAYGRVDRAQAADVIVVLGAGLRRDNTPGPALTRRSARAAELWQAGYAPVIVCSGGKPGNRTRSEADACAELLRGNGVPASAILLEETSRSTEENALETRAIMQTNGWTSAVIVTDGFHLLRATRLFEQAGIRAFPSPAGVEPPPSEYLTYLFREVAAFHWLAFKDLFNLPITYVQGI